MEEILKSRLRVDISVQIAVLPKTLWRSFSGLGIRRRRDLSLVDIMLETFAARLMAPFVFLDADGVEPSEADLYAVIRPAFVSIDEAIVVATLKGEMQADRDKARATIANIVAEAIEARWTYIDRPRRVSHSIRTLTSG